MLLAQIDPKTTAEGLGRDFLPWAVVGLVLALMFVVRVAMSLNDKIHANDKEHTAAIKEHSTAVSKMQSEHAKELRDLLMQIVPLTTKLTEGLEILERLTDRGARHA